MVFLTLNPLSLNMPILYNTLLSVNCDNFVFTQSWLNYTFPNAEIIPDQLYVPASLRHSNCAGVLDLTHNLFNNNGKLLYLVLSSVRNSCHLESATEVLVICYGRQLFVKTITLKLKMYTTTCGMQNLLSLYTHPADSDWSRATYLWSN